MSDAPRGTWAQSWPLDSPGEATLRPAQMSFTNPTNPGDPKPVQVTNGNDPDGGLRGVEPATLSAVIARHRLGASRRPMAGCDGFFARSEATVDSQ